MNFYQLSTIELRELAKFLARFMYIPLSLYGAGAFALAVALGLACLSRISRSSWVSASINFILAKLATVTRSLHESL